MEKKTDAQWTEEAEIFKEEFYFTTQRIPTLDDIKREIATIDDIEDVDEYANILYSYMD